MENLEKPKINYLKVGEMSPDINPSRDLYYVSGTKIHDAHEPLTLERIALMKQAGIDRVATLNEGGTVEELKIHCFFNQVDFQDLGDGNMVLVKDLFDKQGNVLVREGTRMTRPLIDSLIKKESDVFVHKRKIDCDLEAVKRYRMMLEKLEDLQIAFDRPFVTHADLNTLSQYEEISVENLNLRIKEGFETISPSDLPLSRRLKETEILRPRAQSKIENYSNLRQSILHSLEILFRSVIGDRKLDQSNILHLTTRIINGLILDRDLLMNLVNVEGTEDYIRRHSINTCILSIQMATSLGYDDRQVVEVAYGALFSNIGMFRVPKDIRNRKGGLSPNEWEEIRKSPIYSVEYLSRIAAGLPRTTPLIAYQMHERLDGSGYPSSVYGRYIHDFSRIVAIADVYDALITERAWRDAIVPYKAMEEILTECRGGKLDGKILRAFLSTIGLFPVGSWVELNDGRVGQVTGLGESENYDRPIVSLLFQDKQRLMRPQRVYLKEREELKIVDVVDPKDYQIEDPCEGF